MLLFLLTGNALLAQENPREFEMNWFSFSGLGVFSLNNFRFDRRTKKTNYYAMAGVGANTYTSEFSSEGLGNQRKGTIEREWASHVVAGAGFSFRLSPQRSATQSLSLPFTVAVLLCR